VVHHKLCDVLKGNASFHHPLFFWRDMERLDYLVSGMNNNLNSVLSKFNVELLTGCSNITVTSTVRVKANDMLPSIK
jgi:hypothetical protein